MIYLITADDILVNTSSAIHDKKKMILNVCGPLKKSNDCMENNENIIEICDGKITVTDA